VIMLRDPVELVRSLHAQLMRGGDEDLRDLGEALAAEPDRAAGRRAPARGGIRPALRYRWMASLGTHVQRYLGAFDRSQVHVIVLDDIRADADAVVRGLLAFLEVDPGVDLALGRDNPNRNVRHLRLQAFFNHPPKPVTKVARLLPLDTRHRVKKVFLDANSDVELRPHADAEVLAELARSLRPEVDLLEELLGRPLPNWCRVPATDRVGEA
jgi:hypothetical protein